MTKRLAEDAVFIMDRLQELDGTASFSLLAGNIDFSRTAIIGHSRGARAANLACTIDKWFKACIRLDGLGGPIAPVLHLAKPQITIRRPWTRPGRLASQKQMFGTARGLAYDVVITDANHLTFSDLPLLAPEYLILR